MQLRLQSSDAKDVEDFEYGLEKLGPAEHCYENQNTVYEQFDNTSPQNCPPKGISTDNSKQTDGDIMQSV